MVLNGKLPYCSDKLNFFNDLFGGFVKKYIYLHNIGMELKKINLKTINL
jgi:hypothetical protein